MPCKANDGLRHCLDRGDDLGEARGLRRFAKFGDVGAGEKGATGADDHHRLDSVVVAGPAQRLDEPCADLVLQRVDRRVIGGDDRDPELTAKIDAGVDIAHLTPAFRVEIRPKRLADEAARCGAG